MTVLTAVVMTVVTVLGVPAALWRCVSAASLVHIRTVVGIPLLGVRMTALILGRVGQPVVIMPGRRVVFFGCVGGDEVMPAVVIEGGSHGMHRSAFVGGDLRPS